MSNSNQELNSLKKDVEKIQTILTRHVEDTANGTAGGYADVLHMPELKAMAKNAGVTVKEFVESRKDGLVHARDKAEETIHARPFTSAAVAFAAGAAITALLRRK